MTDRFLHGIEIVEINEGARSVRTVKSSLIGLVGTAPDAAGAQRAELTVGSGNAALRVVAKQAGVVGNALRLELRAAAEPNQPLAIAVDGRAPGLILILVTLASDADGQRISTASDVAAALNADDDTKALIEAAALGDGAGIMQSTLGPKALDGGMDEPFPLNVPVLITNRRLIPHLGQSGTLPWAIAGIYDQSAPMIYVVRVAEGSTMSETISHVIGGRDAAGQLTGINALLTTRAEIKPRILIAPGFSHNKPVADALISVAHKLRAIAVIDGPNTSDEAAIDYRAQFGSERAYLVDPWLMVRRPDGSQAPEPASARVAGLIALSDEINGFWASPSNQVIRGVLRPARSLSWAIDDPNTQANYLNEVGVATFIVHDGVRLWGNRSCATDPRWSFLCVRRTADMINESLLYAHLWAVDRNITKTYVDEVTEGVNAYLRQLKAKGAILGGKCWADPDLNTSEAIADGRVYFDFDFTPTYPAEHITFRSRMVGDYLEEIFK